MRGDDVPRDRRPPEHREVVEDGRALEEVDRAEEQVLHLVEARGGDRDPEPDVRREAHEQRERGDPHERVPNQVHRLEVELPEHTAGWRAADLATVGRPHGGAGVVGLHDDLRRDERRRVGRGPQAGLRRTARVRDVVDGWRARQRPVEEDVFGDLEGVLPEVAELERRHDREDRDPVVVLVLPEPLEDEQRDPREQRVEGDDVERLALEDRADLQEIRRERGDRDDLERDPLEGEEALERVELREQLHLPARRRARMIREKTMVSTTTTKLTTASASGRCASQSERSRVRASVAPAAAAPVCVARIAA